MNIANTQNTKCLIILSAIILSSSVLASNKGCENLEFPIVFDSRGLPTIQIGISDNEQTALLDLGSSSGLHAPDILIKNIQGASQIGKPSKSVDLSGEIREEKQYSIPVLKLTCMLFNNIVAKELKPWGLSIGDDKNRIKNKERLVIGRGLFKNKIIGIDYQNKTLTIRNSNNKHAPPNRRSAISFSLSKEGIVIGMKSRYAIYKMVLDTGASISIFADRKVHIEEKLTDCDFSLKDNITCKMFNSTLTVVNQEFKTDILLYPIDNRFEMDGILGSDFFNQFFVELNFLNNTAFITSYE